MSGGFQVLVNRIGQPIRLRSTKLDGSPHFEWTCTVIAAAPEVIVLSQPAGTPITTWKEVWTPNFDARVYFWHGGWHNVIQSWDADGSLHGFYCNVITPARVSSGELRWNDLDLDLIVQPDGTHQILDEDEWAHNRDRLGYPPQIVAHARRALDELVALIEKRTFPFDSLP